MGRAEKLAVKILGGKSDKNFAFNDLCSRARRVPLGFWERKSSDLLQRRSRRNRHGKAKPYQVKQVRELLLKYKIDIE